MTATAKLTKTEQAILDRLAKSRRGRFAFCHGYRTGTKTGLKGYGHRMWAAAIKLRDKGLIRLTFSEERDSRSEYTDHWTEVRVEGV